MRFFLIALLGLIAATSCEKKPSETLFSKANRSGIPSGTVLHYLKSNIDGTNPENVSMYFSSDSTIEAFKFHPGQVPAGFVISEMDWTTFSISTIRSYQDFGNGDERLFGSIAFSAVESTAVALVPALQPEADTIRIPVFPVHFYNSDLVSLNAAFPFLSRPDTGFTAGIVDPTFGVVPGVIFYRGEIQVRYKTSERRNGVLSHVYMVSGTGIGGKAGTLWVDSAKGWIVDAEIYFPDNPDWDTFKLKLISQETMTSVGWKNFRREALEKS